MTAVINGCIEAEESVLSFDLIQFRKDNHEFASNKTAGMQLILKENDEVFLSDIIMGQPDGKCVRHQYNLPAFKGEVEFRFITQSGNTSPTFDMLDFDVLMMDNLSLLNTLSTHDQLDPKQLSIFPNPTNDVINIQKSSKFKNVVISNTQGIALLQQTKATAQIDISGLDSGFYILSAQDNDNHDHQSIFIKIE